MGDLDFGTDPKTLQAIAGQIARIQEQGVEVAVVLGAGNIYRGMAGAAAGMDRATADYMGMLAIVLNALALQDALEKDGVHTRVQSAIEVQEALEKRLRVMDLTALTLCMENNLPIHVFNMDDESNIERIVSGERVGTLVTNE